MGYPYDGTCEYSKDEINAMYKNGDISEDEKENLERLNGYDKEAV